MGITVDVNLTRLRNKFSQNNLVMGRIDLADQFEISAQPFVPKRHGNLRAQRIIAADGSSVIYTQVYAHWQFTAPDGWRYTTPGTGPHWDEQVKANYMPLLLTAFTEGVGLRG
ncbi:MAG: minor capsid protein [Schleiferilactobacillus perolens]|uniref:minor capsid protein n=1 Tax=Schleiferilactobacillus perolens TaxID=100468 RepID=UPI0039E91F75